MLWDPNQNRQQRKNLVTAIFLASDIGAIKTEAHTKRTHQSTRENPWLTFVLRQQQQKIERWWNRCMKLVLQYVAFQFLDFCHPVSL